MQTKDFNIIKNEWSELADFGTQADSYVQSDPQTCAVKLRCFAEKMVDIIYDYLFVGIDGGNTLFDRLANENFKKAIEKASDSKNTAKKIIDKLHLLRVYGNKAAHAKPINVKIASMLVNEAFELAKWLKNTLSDKMQIDIADYAEGVKQIIEEIELPDFFHDTYQFNSDQSCLINELCLFLKSKSQHIFLLKGYAGTGKTFIIKALKEFLDFQRRSVAVAAPTARLHVLFRLK